MRGKEEESERKGRRTEEERKRTRREKEEEKKRKGRVKKEERKRKGRGKEEERDRRRGHSVPQSGLVCSWLSDTVHPAPTRTALHYTHDHQCHHSTHSPYTSV